MLTRVNSKSGRVEKVKAIFIGNDSTSSAVELVKPAGPHPLKSIVPTLLQVLIAEMKREQERKKNLAEGRRACASTFIV